MKDTLISFETAKLAKEKKFKIECNSFYNRGSQYKLQSDSIIRSGDDIIIEAPTQSLLQKWLREVHKIYVEVNLNFNDEFNVAIYDRNYMTVLHSIKNKIFIDSSNHLKLYEEALEVGLQEALKLIK